MARPKGSKNRKKRKYTRRKTLANFVRSATSNDIDHAAEAGALVRQIKDMLMEAEPEAARSAISVLIHDLAMVNRIIGGVPPAP